MSTPKTTRVFDAQNESALDSEYGTPQALTPPTGVNTGISARPQKSSFSSQRFRAHRPSRASNWRAIADEELLLSSSGGGGSDKPLIPSALPQHGEMYVSPLPVLPMIVLSIVMLGEFLSANVSTPFLLFMVKGFGVASDEADVGYWTGILVSCFFVTQFLTSLLWATASERHGTRTVLFVSLLGSSLTCLAFGTSTTLPQAMTIRLLQGVFAGAIGVGRGTVATITDPSNEGRAYAILGFCWGFGGVAGAIIGGSFESPANKWPGTFERVHVFVKYPYLLPTAIAASITFIGAVLCLFVSRDGGPREGAIRLPVEKILGVDTIPEESSSPILEEERPRGIVNQLKKKVSRKLSGYFAQRVRDAHDEESPQGAGTPPVPMSTAVRQTPHSGGRTFSRTSRVNGSAYGYGSYSAFRSRLASNASVGLAGRRGSLASTIARRRGSNAPGANTESPGRNREGSTGGGELNLAQRLLMANEMAVTNIADLWVAAAVNVDNEDVFTSDSELEGADEYFGDNPFADDAIDEEADELPSTPTRVGRPGGSSLLRVPSMSSPGSRRPSGATLLGQRIPRSPHRPSIGQNTTPPPNSRRPSASGVPAIFAHSGVRTPPAMLEQPAHPSLQERRMSHFPGADESSGLETIAEGNTRPSTMHEHAVSSVDEGGAATQTQNENIVEEKQPSMWSQLPVMIIIQYGLLALHSTTHDQIFLSYLVSKYESGGLNLNAGHFAQLIAFMSLASIAYQFYLYPNMGPPRGRFSHLSMFRIGSLLFIPAYLSVILYRPLASPTDSGGIFIMAALAASTAIRYCGITFAYTAVAILLNYTSPPHLLGYANGIAQSIVSFARFVGPVLGGYLWSVSVDGNPSGYPIGFLICSVATAVALAHSFFIR